jgi:hypothetical protein
MHFEPGRLRNLVRHAVGSERYVICHETLSPIPNAQPAICRGFHGRYTTTELQVIAATWGFVEVDPPAHDNAASRRERE